MTRPCLSSRRPVLALLLALLLGLTAQAMAAARGAPGSSGRIEICTGIGPVMVAVDAEGQPVGPPHLCPDWAPSLLAALAVPDVAPLPVAAGPGAVLAVRDALSSDAARPVAATARAPPTVI